MAWSSGSPEQRGTQLLRGVLDVCLLAVIAEKPRYGYELAEELAVRGLSLVREGSIYPLLTRMQRAGLVSAFRAGSSGGPPRKYYRLTPAGEAELATGLQSWSDFTTAVARVLTATPATTTENGEGL